MDEIYKELTNIFEEVFDLDSVEINAETVADDIEQWDSFSHINLIMMIEMRFEIEFIQKEVIKFKNVGDIVECIKSKI